MVAEGEKFAAEDELQRKRVEMLNNLSSFVYGLQGQLEDKKGLGGKLDEHEKEIIADVVKDATGWVEENGQTASLEDLEEKFTGEVFVLSDFRATLRCFSSSEIRNVVNPITSKLYNTGGRENSEESEDVWGRSEDEL